MLKYLGNENGGVALLDREVLEPTHDHMLQRHPYTVRFRTTTGYQSDRGFDVYEKADDWFGLRAQSLACLPQ